jgi:hypothetical protein
MARWRSREGDEDVARAVARHAAGAREAEGGAAAEPLELVREQRGVRPDHDDDRAFLLLAPRPVAELEAHRQPGDPELVAQAVVGLYEHSDRVTTRRLREDARGRPDPALVLVADHAGAPAHATFHHRPGSRGVDRGHEVCGLHVVAVDVVEGAVPGLGHDRQ